jgi:hypothetical protein
MKIIRWIGLSLAAVVVLLLTLVAVLPSLLSTSWGQGLCLRLASRYYPGTVELKTLSVGWFSGIDARCLALHDSEGHEVFSCDHVSVQKPLISFLWAPTDLGKVAIETPQLYCYSSSHETKNEKRVSHHIDGAEKHSHPKDAKTEHHLIIPLKGTVSVTGAKVAAVVDDHVVGALSEGNATIDLDLLHASSGTISAKVGYGAAAPTPLSLTFSLSSAPEWSQIRGSLTFSCTKIPIAFLATLAQSLHPDIDVFLREAFGSSISYSLEATKNGPAVALHSNLSSDNVKSMINMSLDSEQLVVDQGDLITGTLTPRLFSLATQFSHTVAGRPISLVSPVAFSVENKRSLRISLFPLALSSEADIRCATRAPLILSSDPAHSSVAMALASTVHGNATAMNAEISITATSGSDTASCSGSVDVKPEPEQCLLTGRATLGGSWPVLVEALTGMPSTRLLGPTVECEAVVNGPFRNCNNFSFQGSLRCSSLNVKEEALFSFSPDLLLVPHSVSEIVVPTVVLAPLVRPVQFRESQGTVRIHSSVDELSIPLNRYEPVVKDMAFKANVSAKIPAAIIQADKEISCALDGATISCTKEKHQPLVDVVTTGRIALASPSLPLLNTMIGAKGLQFHVNGHWNLEEDALNLQKATVSAEKVSAAISDATVCLSQGMKGTLSSPATFRMTIDPTMFSTEGTSSLARPVDLVMTVQPFSFFSDKTSYTATPVTMKLACDNILLDGQHQLGPYGFSAMMSLDLDHRLLTAAPVFAKGAEQLLKASATVHFPSGDDRPLLETISAECSADVHNFPTPLLDTMLHQHLVDLIGERFSSKLSCLFNGLHAKGNRLQFSCEGPFWKGAADLICNDLRLTSGSGSAIDCSATLSPEWVNPWLQRSGDLTLGEAVSCHITVPSCVVNLDPLFSGRVAVWDMLNSAKLSTNITTSAVSFQRKSTAVSRVPPLTITGNLQPNGAVQFSIQGSGSSLKDEVIVAIQGDVRDAWNDQGLSLPSSRLRSSFTIDQFPTGLVSLVQPEQGALAEEVIGPFVRLVGTASVDAMQSGVIQADLTAKNCTAHVDGTIQQGVLRLNNPARASLMVTKEAGALLMKSVHPLLATAAHSEQPIQVTIDSQGTMVPLSPWALSSICLPKITVDAGKVMMKNGGALKIILALLGMGGAANGNELSVWLTPLYLGMKNGVVTCQRADALVADTLHMIMWGDVDVGHDRINMVVAIPEKSLAALRLQIVTPTPERGLQIPITGHLSNPNIDTKRAAARLAGAGILNNAPDPRLKAFGGLLQAAAATLGEPDQPIPPQTSSPLPWEKR